MFSYKSCFGLYDTIKRIFRIVIYFLVHAVWSNIKNFLRLASYSHETNCRKILSCQDKRKVGISYTGKHVRKSFLPSMWSFRIIRIVYMVYKHCCATIAIKCYGRIFMVFSISIYIYPYTVKANHNLKYIKNIRS